MASWARGRRAGLADSAGVFTASSGFADFRLAAPPRGRQAAGAHDVEAAEDIGMLHADAAGAVAAHGMADQPRLTRFGMVR